MSETEQQQQQSEQPQQAWPFAPSYEASYSGLPASQLREAVKRLAERRRNPLPPEKISQEDPEVEGVLAAVKKAYLAKKERAKVASAAKRAQQREALPDNVAVEVEAAEDLSASVADLSLEVATVVAVEPEPEEPEPEASKPPASKPITIPIPTPKLARQQSQTQQPPAAAAPRNQPAKKSGLAAKFA